MVKNPREIPDSNRKYDLKDWAAPRPGSATWRRNAAAQKSGIVVANYVEACYFVLFRTLGDGMGEETELDLARAMIRLYGADAQSVAAGHARSHAETGDAAQSAKWHRIAEAVVKLRGRTRP
jgi:hypothetical protein